MITSPSPSLMLHPSSLTQVYYVSQRGGGNPPGSYVFFGQLKTSEPTVNTLYGVYQYKWVLAGVGMLMQIE